MAIYNTYAIHFEKNEDNTENKFSHIDASNFYIE